MYRRSRMKCKHTVKCLATSADQTLQLTLSLDIVEFTYLLMFCSLFMQEVEFKTLVDSNKMIYKILVITGFTTPRIFDAF